MNIAQQIAQLAPEHPEHTETTQYGVAYRLGGEDIPLVDYATSYEGREEMIGHYVASHGEDNVTRVKRTVVITSAYGGYAVEQGPTRECDVCGRPTDDVATYLDPRMGPEDRLEACGRCANLPQNTGLVQVVA